MRLVDDPPELTAQGVHHGFLLQTALKPLYLFAASEHEVCGMPVRLWGP